MNDECTVTFEGTRGGTYYVACNLTKYVNKKLVNTSNSTIYLYQDIQQGSQSYSITIPSLSYPYYTSGSNRYYITDAHNVSFNKLSSFYREFDVVEVFLLASVVVFCFMARLLNGRRG